MSVPLANLLPAPKFAKGGGGLLNAPKFPTIDDVRSASTTTEPPASMALTVAGSRTQAPPYGKRKGFVPRVPEDFGDGGAFPEIHIPQFPLFMGRKDKTETRIVPISVDGDGKVKYDAILRQNMRKDQHLYSSFTDIIERTPQASELQRPSREEEEKLAEKTRAALGQLVDKAVTSAQATNIKKENREATFIRYTPQQALANDAHNSGAKQRIIRVQEMPVDPLEPPKFKHAKAPPAPGSPPVPVLHSPPRKLTQQDQQSWKIPPCISNWKNIKGYTVPLHQRMAADGRGLTEVKVNPAFAKLTESLYTAEQIARQEIEERAKLQKKLSQRRQQAKEEELRTLAQKAHEERAAAMGERDEAEDEADIEARAEREAVRREREQEIKREQRMERMKEDRRQAAMGKGPTKVRADEDRDVSEKIALGQLPQTSKDSMFDQRLFNQNQGMSAGFNNDEAYDLYDKPLFNQQKSTYIYRDKGGDTDTYGGEDSGAAASGGGGVSSLLEKSANATKFQPDRGFKGAGGGGGAGGRSKPVEFEKEKPSGGDFGFDQLFSGGDKSKERRPDALDSIGKRGHMSSIGGGSQGQEYSSRHQGSREMEFSESAEKYGSVAGQGGVRRGRDGDNDDLRDDSSSKRSRR